jgi:hypothetical protein
VISLDATIAVVFLFTVIAVEVLFSGSGVDGTLDPFETDDDEEEGEQ